MLYFPLVGWVIGFMSATVMLVARWIFPSASPLLAAFLSLATTVYVTGAFHEDGFADSCDGLGGGWTKSQRVQIMKDSRIGVFGAIGLLLFVGVKTCALASLPDEMVVLACCISHVLGPYSTLT
jgi:adenosylcobinamide-GDP ribazoletransferase